MAVRLAERGIWHPTDGYEIVEIHEYMTRMIRDENPALDRGSYFYCDVRNTRTGEIFYRTMYTTNGTYIQQFED